MISGPCRTRSSTRCTTRSDVASRRPATGAAAGHASFESRSRFAPGAVFFFGLFDPDANIGWGACRPLRAIRFGTGAGREQATVPVQIGRPHREVIAHAAHNGRAGGAVALVMLNDMADAGEQFAPLIVSRDHAFAPNRHDCRHQQGRRKDVSCSTIQAQYGAWARTGRRNEAPARLLPPQ